MKIEAVLHTGGEPGKAFIVPISNNNVPPLRTIATRAQELHQGVSQLRGQHLLATDPIQGRISLQNGESERAFGLDFNSVDFDCGAGRSPRVVLTDSRRNRSLELRLNKGALPYLSALDVISEQCKVCEDTLTEKEALKGDRICSICEVNRT